MFTIHTFSNRFFGPYSCNLKVCMIIGCNAISKFRIDIFKVLFVINIIDSIFGNKFQIFFYIKQICYHIYLIMKNNRIRITAYSILYILNNSNTSLNKYLYFNIVPRFL